MAKQKGKQAAAGAAPAKANGKQINRKRRNSLERKCLPKALKVLFARSPGSVMKAVQQAWSEGRKKVRVEE